MRLRYVLVLYANGIFLHFCILFRRLEQKRVNDIEVITLIFSFRIWKLRHRCKIYIFINRRYWVHYLRFIKFLLGWILNLYKGLKYTDVKNMANIKRFLVHFIKNYGKNAPLIRKFLRSISDRRRVSHRKYGRESLEGKSW